MKLESNYLAVLAAGMLLTHAAAAGGNAPPRYTQAAGAALQFHFVQAGAGTDGRFGKFSTELAYDENNLAASTLKVTVQIASLDTQESERDGILASPDMLDAKKFPTAQYVATSLGKRGDALEAVGKLTLHGVTRDLRLPLAIRKTAGGVEISGETTIRRLDYGVGQGDLKSTEWVGDEVKLQYKVPLTRAQ
jgi:polyisoprenoid-binding protein YceI